MEVRTAKRMHEASFGKPAKVAKRLCLRTCDVCLKVLRSRSELAIHMRKHTGERPYRCDYEGCSAAFTHSCTLMTHKRLHSGEKPYKCDYEGCSAAFAQSNGLVTHKRTHSGEHPYKCDYEGCSSAFSTGTGLTRHKLFHTGETPYPCDYEGCSAAFSRSDNLATHMRIHSEATPFKCDYDGCSAEFRQASNLIYHRKSHSVEGQQCRKKKETHFFRALESYETQRGKWTREHWVNFRCFRQDADNSKAFARLDGYRLVMTPLGPPVHLAGELDEDGHNNPAWYPPECDLKRMLDVSTYGTAEIEVGQQILWLRLNPDAFRVNGARQYVPKKARYALFVKIVEDLESGCLVLPGIINVMYLFYTTTRIDKLPDTVASADNFREFASQVHFIDARTYKTIAQ